MQSGRRKTHQWMVQFEREAPEIVDPLMGWIGSSDPRTQVRLLFDTREEAVAFAERNKLSYVVQEPRVHPVRPKSYAENFRS
jgi:NADH dehydrogenase ubiquinone Fe-S protein 4